MQPNQVLGVHRLLIEPTTLRVHLKWAVAPVHETVTPLDISLLVEHIEVRAGQWITHPPHS